MNKRLTTLTRLSGLGAIFTRGFVEYYYGYDERPVPLRACQEAGLRCVTEIAKDTISVPYIGKRAKAIDEAGVTHRSKQGRNYYLSDDDNLEEFVQWLEDNPDYGSRIRGSEEQDLQRANAFRLIDEFGAIRANSENLIPTAAYRKLNEMVADGTLDVVFLKAGLPAGVKYQGTTVRPPFFEMDDE